MEINLLIQYIRIYKTKFISNNARFLLLQRHSFQKLHKIVFQNIYCTLEKHIK